MLFFRIIGRSKQICCQMLTSALNIDYLEGDWDFNVSPKPLFVHCLEFLSWAVGLDTETDWCSFLCGKDFHLSCHNLQNIAESVGVYIVLKVTFREGNVGIGWQVLVDDLRILNYLGFFVLDIFEFLTDLKEVIEEGDRGLKGRVNLPFLLKNRQIPVNLNIRTFNLINLSFFSFLTLIIPNDIFNSLILLHSTFLEILKVEIKTSHIDILVVFIHYLDESTIILNNRF